MHIKGKEDSHMIHTCCHTPSVVGSEIDYDVAILEQKLLSDTARFHYVLLHNAFITYLK